MLPLPPRHALVICDQCAAQTVVRDEGGVPGRCVRCGSPAIEVLELVPPAPAPSRERPRSLRVAA